MNEWFLRWTALDREDIKELKIFKIFKILQGIDTHWEIILIFQD